MGDFANFVKRTKKGGASGNGGSRPHHYFVPEPSTDTNIPAGDSPSQVGVPDTGLPWLRTLWLHGRKAARRRGSFHSHEQTKAGLNEFAISIANANLSTAWNPDRYTCDAQLVETLQELKRKETEMERKHVDDLTNQEEREREQANNYRDVRKPLPPIITIVLTATFLAMTMAPSFYDGFFRNVGDERLGWLLAGIFGLAGAGAVVALIVRGVRNAR